MTDPHVRVSKFPSLVLRHRPAEIGLALDREGWAFVPELLRAFEAHGFPLTLEEPREVVRDNDKRRFSFGPDGLFFRAGQGHSLEVELGYEPVPPPEVLYHGTAERSLPSVRRGGLVKGRRHHVHLSERPETASEVGGRYGKPVVLKIAGAEMHRDGHPFFRSANGVWLTPHVPVRCLRFGDEAGRR